MEPEWGRRPCDHSAELQAIHMSLKGINTKLETVMSQQSDIDAATAALTALTGDIAANVAQLGTDIDAIKAALAALPASVDTTALDAAVAAAQGTAASLDASVSSVTDLAPPAPPVAGTSN
jgi:peptidoglycan hydrolase CwlO-like protein